MKLVRVGYAPETHSVTVTAGASASLQAELRPDGSLGSQLRSLPGFVWPTGKRYVGGFLNDLKHGDGVCYLPDGKVLKGKCIWFTLKRKNMLTFERTKC